MLTLDAHWEHPLQVRTRDASTQYLPSDCTQDASTQCPELPAEQLTEGAVVTHSSPQCALQDHGSQDDPQPQNSPSPADIPLQLIPNSQGASPNYSLQDEPQRPTPTTTNTFTSPVKSESTDATGKQVMPMATACTNSAGRLSGLGGTSPKDTLHCRQTVTVVVGQFQICDRDAP